MIDQFKEIPIESNYNLPTEENIHWLQEHSKVTNIEDNFRIKALHSYKEIKLAGTLNTMYARQSVVLKLNQALEYLPNNFSFAIFDAFRTIKTQLALFEFIYNQQKELYPNLTHEDLYNKTREFIVNPSEISRYAIPPHNSGGAIDISILCNGQLLDMGTEFDAVTPMSYTNFFEQSYQINPEISEKRWNEIRINRRILFNTLKHVGFTNYDVEWWHYDLGDCMWADILNENWYYPSMENEIML
ncbi:M15 family metallopeptidase [Pigmentibacter sp. JX0631]|uniref:M15 family metallopeptidase n=1 Tax=Pigmentibacter sp. JX0631 TaxID=2976982 RepID=UPI00246846E5|nr:M15 family metallopeptidase [Pigmentibacter sp. JX0631]WGL61342.1 M15 family metallopeptidase [Pigmentibacter sp. JX0631]